MKLTLSLLFLALVTSAQPRSVAKLRKLDPATAVGAKVAAGALPQIITQTSDTAFPFITNGDGLRTRITLLNLEATAATYQMVFVTSDGFSYQVPWADRDAASSIRGTIQPHSMVELMTTGTGEITTGWALASATGARVVFSVHSETASPAGGFSVATYYPGNANSKRQKIRFDNRDGYSTNLVFNNINTTSAAVTILVRDADGRQIGLLEAAMEGANQYGIDMAKDFPATAGILGSVEIIIPTASRSGVGVLGLRMNSSNGAIDLIDAFSTVAWSQ